MFLPSHLLCYLRLLAFFLLRDLGHLGHFEEFTVHDGLIHFFQEALSVAWRGVVTRKKHDADDFVLQDVQKRCLLNAASLLRFRSTFGQHIAFLLFHLGATREILGGFLTALYVARFRFL